MINKLRQISQNKFVRNVAIVATGTAGAQAITMAFAPLITRLYGPEAFGMLGTFIAILSMIIPIAALTYPVAIVLPKSDADAKNITKLSANLSLVISAITAIVLLIAGDWIAQTLNLETIASFLLLMPVAMLFSGYQQIFTQWLIRKTLFKTTARVAIIQAFIINTAKTGGGWFHPVGVVLIVIATIGYAFHAMLLWLGIRNTKTAHSSNDQPTGTIWELAKRYKDFPLYRTPQVFLNAISQGIPVIMLASYFGNSTAGFLALTKSVLAAPAGLIGNSVGNVFYPKAVELYENRTNLKDFLLKTSASLLFIGTVIFLPIITFGPWIFSLIFGSEWEYAGIFARWISLWMIFSLTARPIISVIPIANLQKNFLYLESIFLPVQIGALYTGFIFNLAVVSVALYSITSCLFYTILFFMVLRKI